MGFLGRLFLTFVCTIAGWLVPNIVLFGTVLCLGNSVDYALAWLYQTGSVTLMCWFLFGIPLATLDQRRSWFRRWWTASLFGGMFGVVAFAAYMHWFFNLTPHDLPVWLFAIAFITGSVTLGLYYRRKPKTAVDAT